MKNFDSLFKMMEEHPVRKLAVAVAQDESVLLAVAEARKRKIAEPFLVGDEKAIREAADKAGVSIDGMPVIRESNPINAITAAVKMVSSGDADILMKGYTHTDDFLRGILNKEYGLRTQSIMSHVFAVEVRNQDKLIFVTDAAMNIAPNLEQKAAIMLNAVHLANVFGITNPRVAILAAVELVNPSMPTTVEAACLAKMADRRQYVPACTVDGPLALDNAVSLEAAQHKKITGPVAGMADILVVPTIEAGNMLAKSLVYFGGNRLIGLLVGAKAPVVLTSRADTVESKLMSIAGGVLMVNMVRTFNLKVGKVHY